MLVSNNLLGEDSFQRSIPTTWPWAASVGGRNVRVCGEGAPHPHAERQTGGQGRTRSLQCTLPSTLRSSLLFCPQDGSGFGLDVSGLGELLSCPASDRDLQVRPRAGEDGGRTWVPHRPSAPRSTHAATSVSYARNGRPRADVMAPGAVWASSGMSFTPSVGTQGSPIPPGSVDAASRRRPRA